MDLSLSLIIRGVDRSTSVVRRVTESVKQLNRVGAQSMFAAKKDELTYTGEIAKRARAIGNNFGDAAKAAAGLAIKVAAIGGGAAWLFKSQFIDVAAQFEQFEAVLGTLEGSADKAKASFAWIRDFAKKTPYEVIELTEAFVRLRAYGLDPTDGTLTTLGDTSAAMGKDLMMSVEAIADATTGEFERLKEFGIKGAQKGNLARFEYTDRQGKQQHKIIDRTNRKVVQSTLMAIWNEKYAGAMDTQSRTWKGMVSNLADLWTDFRVSIMKAGVFDFLKTRASELLKTIDALKESGKLQEWASEISTAVTGAFQYVWDNRDNIKKFALDVVGAFKSITSAVGGVRNVFLIVAGIMSASTVNAVVTLVSSIGGLLVPALLTAGEVLFGLGVMLLTTPVGWFIAAVAAIAGVAYLVKKNWGPITAFFSDMWDGVKVAFSAAADWAVQTWQPIKAFFVDIWTGVKESFAATFGWYVEKLTWLRDQLVSILTYPFRVIAKLKGMLGGNGAQLPAAPTLAAATPTLAQGAAAQATQRQEVGGRIGITIDSEGRARVNKLEARGGIDLDVNAGLSMVMP